MIAFYGNPHAKRRVDKCMRGEKKDIDHAALFYLSIIHLLDPTDGRVWPTKEAEWLGRRCQDLLVYLPPPPPPDDIKPTTERERERKGRAERYINNGSTSKRGKMMKKRHQLLDNIYIYKKMNMLLVDLLDATGRFL